MTQLRRTTAVVVLSIAVLSIALIAITAAPAAATWSIVGVDPDTGEVGVAIASCVPAAALGDLENPLEPVVLVPGTAAAVTQAALNSEAPQLLSDVLNAQATAEQAIAAVTDTAFDDMPNDRQHAVVTIDGTAAAFTGSKNQATALDQQAPNVSAQGNILVGDAVVADALAAFQATEGDLADRLVRALQAGSDAGGDSRCDEQTALFAHVAVAKPGDDPTAPTVLLTFAVSRGDENPVQLLSDAFADGTRQLTSNTDNTLVVVGAIAIALLVAIIGAVAFFMRGRKNRSAAAT